MKPTRFTEEQITYAVMQADSGEPVVAVGRTLRVRQPTFDPWRRKYQGVGVAVRRRLTQLEEHRKLNRLVADLSLDQHRLHEAFATTRYGSAVAGQDWEAWADWRKVPLDVIRPGQPSEHPGSERYNGSFREECVHQEWFESIEEARENLSRWRTDDNESRPHSSLGHLPPREVAPTWSAPQAAETQIVNQSMA